MPATLCSLRITRRAADRLRAGHLWVYRTDVEAIEGEPTAGGLVSVVDNRRIPLGAALYSSASTIAARTVSRNPELTRAEYLCELRDRIDSALQLRRCLAPITAGNNAHRLIFSEGDGLPGIIADRYNDLVLVQLLIQGTAQDDVRAVLAAALREGLAAAGEALTVWERPDPRIRELEQLEPPPDGPLFTTFDSTAPAGLSFRSTAEAKFSHQVLAPATTEFRLNNLRFQYDATAGQKTGAFLDQRLNYAAAAAHVAASGRTGRALDVSAVTGVDASRSALEAADRNLGLNPDLGKRCEVDWIEADAFEYLRHLDSQATKPVNKVTKPGAPHLPSEMWAGDNPNLFDAIVLDPPAFAKSKRAAEGALRGYKELNLRAIRLLTRGGTLVTCSCSHHVSLTEFTEIVASAAADTGRRVQLLESRAAALDHPEVLTLPETRYLKCLICRVD